MSVILKQSAVPARHLSTVSQAGVGSPRNGPSRRRRRAGHRMSSIVALCAMGAWAVIGLMPVVAALYAIYGY